MKKIAQIGCLIIVVMMIFSVTGFGAGGTLELIESSPKDGAKGCSMENLAVKLYFDGEFSSEKLEEANKDKVKLYGPEDVEFPTRVLYDKKEKGVVLVVLDTSSKDMEGKSIAANTKYRLVVPRDFKDNNGNTLGEETTVTFTTLNESMNRVVSFVMMIVMFGAIIIFSLKSNKAEAEKVGGYKEDKVNPYKEAKKTGKSVEEIVERDQREKARRAEKEAKRLAAFEEEYDEYMNVYKVRERRSAAAAGSRYVEAMRSNKGKKKSKGSEGAAGYRKK